MGLLERWVYWRGGFIREVGLLERWDYFFKVNDRAAGLNLIHKFCLEEQQYSDQINVQYHDYMYC